MARNRISALLSPAVKSLRQDLGNQKFVYDGAEYYCVPSTLERGQVLSVGGQQGEVKLTLLVLQSDFPRALTADMTNVSADDDTWTADSDYPQPPLSGKTVTFPAPPEDGATEYRVFLRRDSPDKSHYAFVLGDIDL